MSGRDCVENCRRAEVNWLAVAEPQCQTCGGFRAAAMAEPFSLSVFARRIVGGLSSILAVGDKGLSFESTGHADWQRDLSVSYDRIGDVLVSQGNFPEALKPYQAGLAIRERLARTDAGNAEWQRDLSVSNNKIGDVLVSQGNLPEALKSYQAGLAIIERLARTDAGNSEWQRDLIVSSVKIADVFPAEARAMLTRAGEIANRLRNEGRLAPADAWMAEELARRLAALADGG